MFWLDLMYHSLDNLEKSYRWLVIILAFKLFEYYKIIYWVWTTFWILVLLYDAANSKLDFDVFI